MCRQWAERPDLASGVCDPKESLNIAKIRKVDQRNRKLSFISKVYYLSAFVWGKVELESDYKFTEIVLIGKCFLLRNGIAGDARKREKSKSSAGGAGCLGGLGIGGRKHPKCRCQSLCPPPPEFT